MTLDPEIRNGYTVSAEMKKVWAVELQLFHKLMEVCKKYDLKIVACGGTCLGAVREHGFIPWDDDIDMEMLRPDYDKLVEVAPKEFTYPYFFQCWQTENNYCTGHAQLRMSHTTAIAINDCRDINHGIPLDIFVLDAVPETEAEIEKLRKKSMKMKQRLKGYSFIDYSFYDGGTINAIISWIIIKAVGFRQYSKQLEDLFRARKVEDAKEVATMSFFWGQFERVRRSAHMMDNIVWLPFEDTLMPVPATYDEILTRHFGDYMKPVEGGALHSGFDALDADRPYQDYLPAMRKKDRKESFVRKFGRLYHLIVRK